MPGMPSQPRKLIGWRLLASRTLNPRRFNGSHTQYMGALFHQASSSLPRITGQGFGGRLFLPPLKEATTKGRQSEVALHYPLARVCESRREAERSAGDQRRTRIAKIEETEAAEALCLASPQLAQLALVIVGKLGRFLSLHVGSVQPSGKSFSSRSGDQDLGKCAPAWFKGSYA
ncbi:hypothetical protein IE53DRAFT_107497 [Violaceomyces palustris]|uniref:Uncharacterized protein n=1 Tax=Violaceomyces palustris TaxID=1673888 RepID=A0ACD0NWL3_9BASI|nr:hypothetical protein IE53DRAFT_107497 [Violaceomyces palustris]